MKALKILIPVAMLLFASLGYAGGGGGGGGGLRAEDTAADLVVTPVAAAMQRPVTDQSAATQCLYVLG
jgi:hypothetical protein